MESWWPTAMGLQHFQVLNHAEVTWELLSQNDSVCIPSAFVYTHRLCYYFMYNIIKTMSSQKRDKKRQQRLSKSTVILFTALGHSTRVRQISSLTRTLTGAIHTSVAEKNTKPFCHCQADSIWTFSHWQAYSIWTFNHWQSSLHYSCTPKHFLLNILIMHFLIYIFTRSPLTLKYLKWVICCGYIGVYGSTINKATGQLLSLYTGVRVCFLAQFGGISSFTNHSKRTSPFIGANISLRQLGSLK